MRFNPKVLLGVFFETVVAARLRSGDTIKRPVFLQETGYAMKDMEDAYGHVNWEHFKGRESCEVVEREDGFIDVSGGPSTYFSTFPQWPRKERDAMQYVRGRVLDIGCGPGRHSLYLQGRGHRVTGVDISPLNIRICRERGLRDARVMSVTQLRFPASTFDTVLMLGNNFGLMANAKRARWLLHHLRVIMTPGGRIIAESRDPYRTEEPFHLAYQRWNRSRGRMSGQLRIRVRWKRYCGSWFDYLCVSPEEMREILQGTGWRIARTIHDRGATNIYIMEREPTSPRVRNPRPPPRAGA